MKEQQEFKKRKWSQAEIAHWKKTQKEQDEALLIFLKSKQASFPVDCEKTIMVSNEFFSGTARWRRKSNVWSCFEADPVLSWMKTTPFNQVQIELLKRGCRWSWSPVMTGTTPQQAGLASNASCKGSKHTAHENLTDREVRSCPAGDAAGDVAGPLSLQTGVGPESNLWGRQPQS